MSRLSKILFCMAGVSLVAFVIIRLLAGAWVPFMWVALGFFLAFAVGASYLDRAFFKEFLGMKTTKQGFSMGAMILMVLVLLIAVNFIGARRYTTWDLSQNKVNTLSDQSLKLLKGLNDDLKVIYFYKNGTDGVDQNRRSFVDLIRKYQDQTPFVKLEFVEVNERPDLAEKYGIKKGTQAVLLDYKGHTNLIEKIDEQELTSALVKVTRDKEKKIFVLSGHHELGLQSSADGQSLSLMKTLLEGNRYSVEAFSLTTAPAVPADADVVMIVGPQQNFLEAEIKALEDYLKRGGSLILAVKPRAAHGLGSWLARLGVVPQNNFLVTSIQTPMGRALDPRFTRGSVFSTQNKITAPFGKSEFTVFHLPQALKKGTVPEGVSVDEFVKTNESAVAFDNLDFEKGGTNGPFTLGMDVKGVFPGSANKDKPFELLVFGDSEFMNDQYFYQNLNRDLVLNSVSALAKEENLISITPKEVSATKLELTDTNFVLYVFAFIIPLPILIFGLSGALWFRRRYA